MSAKVIHLMTFSLPRKKRGEGAQVIPFRKASSTATLKLPVGKVPETVRITNRDVGCLIAGAALVLALHALFKPRSSL